LRKEKDWEKNTSEIYLGIEEVGFVKASGIAQTEQGLELNLRMFFMFFVSLLWYS
jgi:hypothetical protein